MAEPTKISEKAIAVRDASVPASQDFTAKTLALIKRTIAIGATDDELELFLYDCKRRGVHPLDKLLHFTKRSGKYTPIVSIDYLRMRAAESNEMAGSDDAIFSGDYIKPDSATVTVYRLTNGERYPYTATAAFKEYYINSPTWNKMPRVMIAKCAEALALRKAFPQQLAGLYTAEEMDQAGEDSEANLKTVTSGKVDYPAPTERGLGRYPGVPFEQESSPTVQQAATAPAPKEAPLNKYAKVPTPYDETPAPDDFTDPDNPDLSAEAASAAEADIDHVPDPQAHIEATGNLKAEEGWEALKTWWLGTLTKKQQDHWRPTLEKRWQPRARQVGPSRSRRPT